MIPCPSSMRTFCGINLLGYLAQTSCFVQPSSRRCFVTSHLFWNTEEVKKETKEKSHRSKRVSSNAELRYPVWEVPQPERLVIIGDVHGDISAFQSALRMAELIDNNGKWSGGETVLVQSGDIFDRGEHDLVVEELLYCIQTEAKEAGGSVHNILGNHEVLNACMDHSMAARAAFTPFDDLKPELLEMLGNDGFSKLSSLPEWSRCRIAAMFPGGPVAKMLASHGVSIKVGDTLITHAGILPHHLSFEGGLEGMNERAYQWLSNRGEIPVELLTADSPVWTRLYSSPDSVDLNEKAKNSLNEVLELTNTKRMVIGHTPQRMGINSAAGGGVWRIDTAMCSFMGGKPEVLEICGDQITVFTENGRISGEKRAAKSLNPTVLH